MIAVENKTVEHNRTKGTGKTKAFEGVPINLDSSKPYRDDRGRIAKAITVEQLQRQLQKSLVEIRE